MVINIRHVAVRTGLSPYAIRFYEKIGVLPPVSRGGAGVRNFTESDVTFLEFITALRHTGLSLQDIKDFTQDGCILERVGSDPVVAESVQRRIAILKHHQQRLIEQDRQITLLMDAVRQKLAFYEDHLKRLPSPEVPS